MYIEKNFDMIIDTKYDVIVVGGGIAGVSAAVKAGREGAKTLLIEHYGFVGGMSTAGMVSPFMKHQVNGETLVNGVFSDIENEMRKRNGMIDNGFFAQSFRTAAYHLLFESNCSILFNSEIAKVNRKQNKITSLSVLTENKLIEIEAEVFIDTTGDAQLLYLGDFPWVKGDETSGHLQALTLFFRMGNIDIKKATEYVASNKEDFFKWMTYDFDFSKIISIAGYFSNVKKAISEERLNPDVEYIFFTTLPESGEGSFNTSNILGMDASSSESLTKAEMIGRNQVYQVVQILQNEIPGFENSYLLETAVQVGVRETRRAVGDYIVTGNDIKNGSKFDDAIARGCYGIDIHGQKGESSRMEDLDEGQFYEIPLRSLIVKDADNLLVAGRCISSTREGHSALRIMPTSAATGEACGALAALASKSKTTVRQIDYNKVKSIVKHNISI